MPAPGPTSGRIFLQTIASVPQNGYLGFARRQYVLFWAQVTRAAGAIMVNYNT